MRSPSKMLGLVLALTATAVLAVGAGTAAAHGGDGAGHFGSVSTTKLVTAAAKQLNVTSAKLKAAILTSAEARVDAALEDEDIDKDEAADLKEEAANNLNVAYGLSRASTVAKALGITTTQLNDAFRAARKALITQKIDAAVEDGDLTADEAADLKAELADATLPGYKAGGFGFGGFGFGGHEGPGGHRR
jgi:hypothetical protein